MFTAHWEAATERKSYLLVQKDSCENCMDMILESIEPSEATSTAT